MDIAIDFDGTAVTHAYPEIGVEIGAAEVLTKLVDAGHRLILSTMRSDHHPATRNRANWGMDLTDAINWFKRHGIPLYGIQTNPVQHKWTYSPKCYADMYIGDDAFGCPIITDLSKSDRPYVDWPVVEKMLYEQGIIG